MYLSQIVLAVIVCPLALAQETVITDYINDCGSKEASVFTAGVEGCQDSDCKVRRGEKVNFKIGILPLMDVASATLDITAYSGGVAVVIKLDSSNNACDYMACPLRDKRRTNFDINVPIKKLYLPVPVEVKWRVVDDETLEDVVCVNVNFTVY